jgi:ketosteroid isomerase-like protein
MSRTAELTRSTRAVAEGWVAALIKHDLDTALGLLAPDVEFVNYTPIPGYNDDMQWIGTYHGREAVLASLKVFAGQCEVHDEKLVKLVVEGNEAMAVVHETSVARATGVEFEVEFIQWLTVRDGQIARWKSFTDPSSIVRALRGDRS